MPACQYVEARVAAALSRGNSCGARSTGGPGHFLLLLGNQRSGCQPRNLANPKPRHAYRDLHLGSDVGALRSQNMRTATRKQKEAPVVGQVGERGAQQLHVLLEEGLVRVSHRR